MGMFDFLKEIPLSAVLREKLKDVESEVATLKQQNQSLRESLGHKEQECHALTAQIATLTARLQPAPPTELAPPQQSILLVLAQHGEVEEAFVAQLASLGPQVAAYHLEELRRRKFVHPLHTAGSDWSGAPPRTDWTLEHAGREYLIQRGLIK